MPDHVRAGRAWSNTVIACRRSPVRPVAVLAAEDPPVRHGAAAHRGCVAIALIEDRLIDAVRLPGRAAAQTPASSSSSSRSSSLDVAFGAPLVIELRVNRSIVIGA